MNVRGFTLVEVVIVVALVAILVAVAVPSYRTYVQRAHRTEAIALLLRVAQCQETTRARTGAYDAARCLPVALPGYRFDYASGSGPMNFRVLARPLAAQQSDACGTLALDQSGARTAQGDGWKCWSGR